MEIIIGLIVLYVVYRVIKEFSKSNKSYKSNEIMLRVETSDQDNYRSRYKRNDEPKGESATWHEFGKPAKIQGYDIPDGLVYVGTNLPDYNGYSNDACLINPEIKVSPAEPWEAGEQMGYWPHYSRVPSKCRGAYLKWLATKRSEPETYIGYVFLFFYGLERRLFVDGPRGIVPEKERLAIVNEVRRLLKIYSNNRSFRGYATNLLAMEWVLYQSDKPIPDYINFDDRYCAEPFYLLLAKTVAAGKPISANIALQWLNLHPNFRLHTPARRCPKEFRILFFQRYKKKYGDGLVIKPNKTLLNIEYRAASSSISREIKLKVSDLPNPFILTGPIKKFGEIAEECTKELEPYSRFLGRKDNDPKSLNALSLIPKELIGNTSGAKTIKDRLSKICNGKLGFISFENLYKTIGQQPPNQIHKKDLESLANFIETMDSGIAPDIRYHNMKPTLDGNVVIFTKGHGADFRPSKEFRTVGTIIRLGAMVSQIDKDVTPAEEKLLQSLIQDDRELNSIEKDSLMAFLHWCLRTPQNIAGLKQRLSEVSDAGKTAISHVLISVAHADGQVKPEEIKQLEKLYTTLGLNKNQVTSDLHALVSSSGPATVGLRDIETTYSIPQPAKPLGTARGFVLNEELIRIREEETKQVKSVLEDIFIYQDKDDTEVEPRPGGARVSSDPLTLLDATHQSFLKYLMTQGTWERDALHKTCKDLGLMVDGAMEIINEWAFENANAPLIDDGEPVYFDINLAKEILNG